MDRRERGQQGEAAVAHYLGERGFSIVARNARVGRLEIDLIALRSDLLVFCEVKTAAARSTFGAAERLTVAQRDRLRRAASAWLGQHPASRRSELRFDAAFVTLQDDGEAAIEYYAGAF